MFWPDEMHVSMVARSRLLDRNIVSDSCSVRVRRQVHVHPCNHIFLNDSVIHYLKATIVA